VPTDENRRQVETLAGFGIPQPDIGRTIGVNDDTLRKYYRDELDSGTTKANAAVAQSLYRKALGDGTSAVTAAIFWLKTRAQWRETNTLELSGKGGGPIAINIMPDDQAL
jgi:hypothetical protein